MDVEKESASPEQKKTILVLGDSITKEMTPGGSYSKALQELFDKNPSCKKFQVVEKGLAGAETRDLAVQVESLLVQYKPKIVMTMIGGADRIVWPEESWNYRIYINLRELRIFRLAQLLLWNYWKPSAVVKEGEKLDSQEKFEAKFSEYYNTGRDDPSYTHSFGAHLRNERLFAQAENYHQKILEKYPDHNAAKIELGYVWKELSKNSEAEAIFKKAIENAEASSDPGDDHTWGYIGLAELYGENFKDWKKASLVLKDALERLPTWHFLYLFQAKAFSNLGDLKGLEEILKKGIEMCPNEYRLYFQLADFYQSQNRGNDAQKIKALGVKARALDATSGETKKWYQRLHSAVRKAGAIHYALGYPLRKSEAFQLYFDPGQPVALLSNERIYQEDSPVYGDYFIDEFGGDFGHLTPKAAKIVAQNIYNKMMEERECEKQ